MSQPLRLADCTPAQRRALLTLLKVGKRDATVTQLRPAQPDRKAA